jgi:hypothetical protein
MHHNWNFFRAGGFDQVRLETARDLENLEQLDQKLWVALACPTSGLQFDAKTLALIDTDKDGRIRAAELLAAVKWTCVCLRNPADIHKGEEALPLAAINDKTPAGRQVLASARQILVNLGKKEAVSITLDDTTDTAKIFATTRFNGDGIITLDATEKPALQTVVADIIACLGSETDRSGKPGISQAKLDQFFADAKAYADWWDKAAGDPQVLPLGAGTAAAAAAITAIQAKVDDYFARSCLAAFDSRAVNALNHEEKAFLALADKDLTSTAPEIAAFPLARVEPFRPLPLREGVNPAWVGRLRKLEADVVKPLLGDKDAITEGDWHQLQARLAAYQTWLEAKAGMSVDRLGLEWVRELLAGQSREELAALIAQDKALEAEAANIASVDKLIRYHRDLSKLLHNFVSFRDFYRRDKAIFQAGTLFLDQRSCDLCLRVEDPGRHALMAGLSGTYLAYCDCVRPGSGEKMQIAAAFTDGDSDNLMVGRNGVFYDRQGRDWDATIAKIIDNPISIRQAFWSPYKKLTRWIEENVAKRAAAAEITADEQLAAAAKVVTAAERASATAAAEKAKAAAAGQKKIDVGVVAALGVAFGTIGSAVSGLATGLIQLSAWQIPLVLAGMLLLVSGPSMILAFVKLRKRNLGPILDANGWAVNAKARINVPFGRSLTQIATLPPESHRDLIDPYAEKKNHWPVLIGLVVGVWIVYATLNHMGLIYSWTHGLWGDPRPGLKNELPAQAEAANAPVPKPSEAGK